MDTILIMSSQAICSPAADPAAEANHRIANNLALLVALVRMQSQAVKKKGGTYGNAEVRQLLDGVAARIGTIGQLHRVLSQIEKDGVINLKPHLHDVAD